MRIDKSIYNFVNPIYVGVKTTFNTNQTEKSLEVTKKLAKKVALAACVTASLAVCFTSVPAAIAISGICSLAYFLDIARNRGINLINHNKAYNEALHNDIDNFLFHNFEAVLKKLTPHKSSDHGV